MAGSKSNYLSKKLLDHVLGNTAYTAPATVYVGLWNVAGSLTDTATGSATNEVSGGSYARASVTNNTTNWPASTGTTTAAKSNATAVTFITATGSWGTVYQTGLIDASSNGNLLYWSDVTTPKAVSTSDTVSFAIGAISLTED